MNVYQMLLDNRVEVFTKHDNHVYKGLCIGYSGGCILLKDDKEKNKVIPLENILDITVVSMVSEVKNGNDNT